MEPKGSSKPVKRLAGVTENLGQTKSTKLGYRQPIAARTNGRQMVTRGAVKLCKLKALF